MRKLKKILKNKKIISILIGILLILMVIIVIANTFFAKKDLNSKKLKNEDVYIYFGEEKFDFKGNIILDHDNHITSIQLDKKKTKLYNEPIYYTKKKQVILPTNYSYVTGSVGVQKKVNYYSEIININDEYYIVQKDLEYKMNHDFLFDGKDFYLFIEDMDIEFGDKKISISPLSYVNYIYDTKELYIYNYNEDKIHYYENVNEDVFAKGEKYEINISADSLIINGKDKLLMKNFDYLKKLK